jgi:hypothetical protein
MLVAREHSGMTLREIGQKLGGMSYDAVSRSQKLLDQASHRGLVKRLREIRRIFRREPLFLSFL